MDKKNVAEIEKHRLYLEKHPVEWIQFFFLEYTKFDFAPFQIRAINRCLKYDEWYEVLSWARSLAKSTITMFIILFLVLTGRKKNIIMTSATQDAAIRLLDPYKKELEGNARIRAYYGQQLDIAKKWTEIEFVTASGAAFRAIGANNAPRGTRNKADRPDVLLVDDYDTDEACHCCPNKLLTEKNEQIWDSNSDILIFYSNSLNSHGPSSKRSLSITSYCLNKSGNANFSVNDVLKNRDNS